MALIPIGFIQSLAQTTWSIIISMQHQQQQQQQQQLLIELLKLENLRYNKFEM